MNVERPIFESKPSPLEPPLVLPEAFVDALRKEQPDGLKWDRMDGAIAVLKGEKDAVEPKVEEKPTEVQKYWRDMYRTGKLSPYQKDRPGLSWEAISMAWIDPQTQGETNRFMAVDMAMRGGADKEYNQLGDMGHRAERMAVMTANVAPYLAFDVLTSIPASLVIEAGYEKALKSQKANQAFRGAVSGLRKIDEVANDKVVTAMSDIIVRKMTGEKGGWVHEAPDKLADTLQTALPDYYKDMVNGPVLQSVSQAAFNVPIAGALFEQIWTRVSLWQEQSQLNKGLAKSLYMGVGTAWGVWRELENNEARPKRAWSSVIARKMLGLDKKVPEDYSI